ncbi:MAG: SAM-dependent methyltransferase [Bacteroidota bacterium]|nr:SAM-dependent methyltransferase [Bacteroidota bacterium]
MKETGSATAVGAATLKAAHQLIDGDEKLLNDPVILKLLGPETEEYLNDYNYHFFTGASMALRTHVLLRSRYTEDCSAEAYQKGLRQFLFLGAGLETFAYRQPEWARGINIVEADHPTSQADKIQRLNNAGIIPPQNLSFIAVDFESDDLSEVFRKSKLNLKEPVFTACLGVLIYLTRDTADKIFHFLGGLPKGSEFIFSASQNKDNAWATRAAERSAAAGEPWITYFEPDELIKLLKGCGFTKVSFLTTEETEKLYFEGTRIRLPLPARASIVRAVI